MVYSSAQAYLNEGLAKGRVEGRVEGLVEGRAETLLELLEVRFGQLPAQIITAVRALSPDRLHEITRLVITAKSLADLHLD